MVSFEARVDGASASYFNEALDLLGKAMGESSAIAPKIAACNLCYSLKARTKKAKKTAPEKEWRANYSEHPPHYITYKNGMRLDRPLHRWDVTRKLGTTGQYTKSVFVYMSTKQTNKGNVVKDKAAELREIKKYHLGIFHAGLAKASWTKVKDEIKKGSSSVTWPKRRNDRREPLKDARGGYTKRGITISRGVAVIKNHLDYIEDALERGALEDSMTAAAKKLVEYNILKKMANKSSVAEVLDRAKALSAELKSKAASA